MKTLLKRYSKHGFDYSLCCQPDTADQLNPNSPHDIEVMADIERGDLLVFALTLTVESAGVILASESIFGIPSPYEADIYNSKIFQQELIHVLEPAATRSARQVVTHLPIMIGARIVSWTNNISNKLVTIGVSAALWAYPMAVIASSIYLHVFRPR